MLAKVKPLEAKSTKTYSICMCYRLCWVREGTKWKGLHLSHFPVGLRRRALGQRRALDDDNGC